LRVRKQRRYTAKEVVLNDSNVSSVLPILGFAIMDRCVTCVRSHLALVCGALAWASLASALWADVFVLESGGRVEGEWLNREESPLTRYLVRRGGVTLHLPASSVRETARQSPTELEYGQRAPVAADTVAGQWELAEWCRRNSLKTHREAHLRRVIELEPNHQQARFALGYQFFRGQWVVRSEARRQEGYELYKGKWLTTQEIHILEERERNEREDKEWLVRLTRWRKELDDPDKARHALASIVAVNDPAAVRPLGELFAREGRRNVKAIYADVLAKIKTPQAIKVLVDRSLGDLDDEVYFDCVGKLAQLRVPHVGDAFVQALQDADNRRVNRAAGALARLQDKTAIAPLIEALTTTHTRVVNPGLGGEATTTAFTSSGMSMKKGEGPEVQIMHVQNQTVLDALTKLTGADFGFDARAWRYWHSRERIAREAAQPTVDARRN
jgi:hypothetical protein